MISPGRLYWLIRRDLRRGLKATHGEYVLLPRIKKVHPLLLETPPESTPVHLLTGNKTILLTGWMLASWFRFTERNWNIVIHDDGSLRDEDLVFIKRLLPQNSRTIRIEESDVQMQHALAPYPACARYRNLHPLAKKCFDIPQFTKGKQFIILDSDLLFFQKPIEVLNWVDNSQKTCWFNKDFQEPSPLTPDEIQALLGIQLWPCVNSGLCLLQKKVIDFNLFEKVLNETNLWDKNLWRVEQLLLALAASRHNKGGLLPPTYEVSPNKHKHPESICRHYVGYVRDRFYVECGSLLPLFAKHNTLKAEASFRTPKP